MENVHLGSKQSKISYLDQNSQKFSFCVKTAVNDKLGLKLPKTLIVGRN